MNLVDIHKVMTQLQSLQNDPLTSKVISKILTDIAADLPTLIEEIDTLVTSKNPMAAIALGTNLLNLADEIYQLLTGDPPASPVSTTAQVQTALGTGALQLVTQVASSENPEATAEDTLAGFGAGVGVGALLTRPLARRILFGALKKFKLPVARALGEGAVLADVELTIFNELPAPVQDFLRHHPTLFAF